jgi:hypothetical protein
MLTDSAVAGIGRRLFTVGVLCGSIAVVQACGSGAGSPSGNPTPVSTPAPMTTLVASGTQALTAHHFLRVPFTTGRSGSVGVVVEWTFATDLVWVDVAAGDCAITQFQAGQCEFVVASNETTSTARKSLSLPAMAAGTHTLIIDNRGPADESLSYQVTLTD